MVLVEARVLIFLAVTSTPGTTLMLASVAVPVMAARPVCPVSGDATANAISEITTAILLNTANSMALDECLGFTLLAAATRTDQRHRSHFSNPPCSHLVLKSLV